ncbi:co-chaperone YbbN [Streptomyces sp. UNOB3_S3]|uniref:thioredoxin family protein n=1 Tax=Streptomyces sp. UNOB3_S3 TaxID=2871682 RepID=UPI001E3DEA8C|nr:thioredoxin family protein [Streptomyces sp. UNOB3_S3]MCC3777889.1 thioredoxin family protein [Streptomyces sp. UNOB3_S3]
MPVTPLTSLDEFERAIAQERPVVICFCATWANLCRTIAPVFERLSELPEFSGTVGFHSVDVDEAYDVVQKAGVGPVPAFVAFRGGSRLAETVAPSPEALRELIGGVGAMGPS